MSSSNRRKIRSREDQLILRREKEYDYQKFWNDRQSYYQHWDKHNTLFEGWTSPRYYDTNNKLIEKVRNEKFTFENLSIRRQKLKELYEQEEQDLQIELSEFKAKSEKKPRSNLNDIPTEILKDIHKGIMEKEEAIRKQQVELKLYDQWRKSNPLVRDYDRLYNAKDIKLSWLDQQIEKQMRKEKEEEQNRAFQKDCEERLKESQEKDKLYATSLEQRNKELNEIIGKQVEQLKCRQRISEALQNKEAEEQKRQLELADLEEKRREIEQKRKQREIALFNIHQFRIKLQQKLKDIQISLKEEEELVRKMQEMELAEQIQDKIVKHEIKQGISDFLHIVREQKELEQKRKKQLEFLFDSEVKQVYDKQNAIWKKEEKARNQLLTDILATINKQVELNAMQAMEDKKRLIQEREVLVQMTEEYDEELKQVKEEEQKRKMRRRKELDEQIKMKLKHQKVQEEDERLKKITEELERAKIEEERLKREIMHLHRGQGLFKPSGRSNIVL